MKLPVGIFGALQKAENKTIKFLLAAIRLWQQGTCFTKMPQK
jgi:hypothetical protein